MNIERWLGVAITSATIGAVLVACSEDAAQPPGNPGGGDVTTDASTTPTPPDAAAGDANAQPDASSEAGSLTPARLTIAGRLLSYNGSTVKLRGGNFDGIATGKPAADKLAVVNDFQSLKLNFARYRISFNNVDRPSCLSETEEAYLDDLHYLTDAGIWVLVEMRAEDAYTSDDPNFYVPGSAINDKFKCAWTYTANKVKNLPFIAGYGLLAEPSTNKSFPANESADKLRTFQAALMDHITQVIGDTWTPFFIGTDFNYDTMQYRKDVGGHDGDLYYTALPAAYKPRVIYEVNFLSPKPWINEGTGPGADLSKSNDLGAPIAWPQPNPTEQNPFDFFITPNVGGFSGETGWAKERIYNHHREDPTKFPLMMSQAFADWYIKFAYDFSVRNQVPMVVDQFGAARESNATGTIVQGQTSFEKYLVELFEAKQLGWSRWGYNAGDRTRRMDRPDENLEIREYYKNLAP